MRHGYQICLDYTKAIEQSVVTLCSEKKETLDLGRLQCSLGSLVLT